MKNGCNTKKKVLVDKFRRDCFDATGKAKAKYLNDMGEKLKDSKVGTNAYWKILNTLQQMSCP